MSDAVDSGITVTEIAAMDHPIDVSPETTAAFVGRALRGPLNTPVLVDNLADFQRRFGGSWSRSSLGPAVEQFFAHGGSRLYVVRVANSARAAMLCLPADGSAVVLRAAEPGSTERIRAAVDYDGIDADNDELFNLTLQRVNPTTGLIEDQEIFRRVSYLEEAPEFVGNALLASSLARVERPYPAHRPECTMDPPWRSASPYVESVQAGTDGTELTDYDLIGSRKKRTGLFALEHVEDFDVLYLPPTGKGVDTGPAAILAAEQYCRERRAMLIVDPRAEWGSAGEAARGVRDLGYASPAMLGYFPRMRERGADATARAIGGAVAGLLCKQDRLAGPWSDLDQPGLALQRSLVPAVAVSAEDAGLLHRAGLNVIEDGPAGRSRLTGGLTMGRGSEPHRRFSRLSVQRFCLRIISTIAAAAKWSVFSEDSEDLVRHVRGQVLTYFSCLADLGALADERVVVECDVDVNARGERSVTILVVFHPLPSDQPVSLTLTLTPAGCRVGSAAFVPSVGHCA